MEFDEVMAALEAEGTAQNRKIYPRHGAQEPMFGVSYAALGELEKKIKVDHDLGLALWDSGNHDARMLAAKIVDPQEFAAKLADAWARDAVCYQTAGAVADVVARSPVARNRSDVWRDRRGEWVASAGWGIVARTCEDEDLWSIADLRALLRQIEEEIHDRPEPGPSRDEHGDDLDRAAQCRAPAARDECGEARRPRRGGSRRHQLHHPRCRRLHREDGRLPPATRRQIRLMS